MPRLSVQSDREYRDAAVVPPVLSQLLSGIGCQVELVEDVLGALELLRTGMPDIVFMDICMPGMEGLEGAQCIFEEFGRNREKLVAISASALAHERESYLEARFGEFVGKPFRFEEICEILRRLLNVEFTYAEGKPEPATVRAAFDPRQLILPVTLRQQLQEAAKLAGHFLGVLSAEMGMSKPGLNRQAVAALEAYGSPGNIRELKNLIERALIESGGAEILPEHLYFVYPAPRKAVEPRPHLCPCDAKSATRSNPFEARPPASPGKNNSVCEAVRAVRNAGSFFLDRSGLLD